MLAELLPEPGLFPATAQASPVFLHLPESRLRYRPEDGEVFTTIHQLAGLPVSHSTRQSCPLQQWFQTVSILCHQHRPALSAPSSLIHCTRYPARISRQIMEMAVPWIQLHHTTTSIILFLSEHLPLGSIIT